MTLEKTWRECLRMWKEIAEQVGSVDNLKRKWLLEHGYHRILNNCFFCDYIVTHKKAEFCTDCPGRLVDKRFACGTKAYHFAYHPKKFYQKLLALYPLFLATNKKRKSK